MSMVPDKEPGRRGWVINYLVRNFGGFYGETPEAALESCRAANPNLRGGPEAFTVAGEVAD